MKSPQISSKKIALSSQYNYFDLLPNKKHQQCNTRIPQTVILQKGFIKDWIFNSHKQPNHPILKKRKQNLSTLAVVKTFCNKNGYLQAIQGCNNIRDVRDRVKEAVREQKDYDFVKDKKVIEVVTVSNQVLVMTLVDFLDYVAENKYSEQNFYEKWKMIQQRVSFTKIDECYRVQNIRNNHTIQSKCQKIITVNTTQIAPQSTQLQDDPYKRSSPSKTFQIAQTKNTQGYKFFDTFLNKKFFQMSAQLIQFIEKNFKCIVEEVQTRFVINKEREPYLVGISGLEIKPAKKIAQMKEFLAAKEKGVVRVDEYERCLETYFSENMDRTEHYNINTPLSEQRRKRCKGKFCKMQLQQVSLPAILQHKLKLPTLSSQTRVIQPELRDSVLKRRRRVLEKLVENKVISQELDIEDQSSEYETQGEEETGIKNKNRLLKVCQNCYTFYFHVSRFFDLDVYGNLVEKKGANAGGEKGSQADRESQIKGMSFLSKDQIKKMRSKSKVEGSGMSRLDQLGAALINEKQQSQQKAQYAKQISQLQPVTTLPQASQQKLKKSVSQPKFRGPQKSSSKPQLSPIKQSKPTSLSKTDNKMPSSSQKLPVSKVKLDPITHEPATKTKKQIVDSIANNYDNKETKGYRLLTLTKLSQPAKLQKRTKSKTMMNMREKRPENFLDACDQVIKKLSVLPDSSRQQFIYYAKKYYKDNLPQPIQRRSYSSYTEPHLYQFMSLSPISIHPKRRIKKRPQMSLKRLSQLTDYPQIVSRSQFIFDTVIINQQTTIPFCVLTTDVVNPDNISASKQYQNIFVVSDIFDCFIENIALSKQLLQEQEVYNKRIILFNYPGQSHTIYNRGNIQAYGAYFGEIMDKLVFRLSKEKGELGVIDLDKDLFKFCGFGFGAYLLSTYLGSYSVTFGNNISSVMLINPFMQYPASYKNLLTQLQSLYSNQSDPTIEPQSHLYYNKSINSEQQSAQDLQHKSGLNPIRIQDRLYLLECAIAENKVSENGTNGNTIQPEYFQLENRYQVSVVYGKSNVVVPKDSALEFLKYRSSKLDIPNRVIVELYGGHDIMADNYDDIFRVLTLFLRK